MIKGKSAGLMVAMVIALLAGSFPLASAKPACGQERREKGARAEGMVWRLDLTKAQRAAISSKETAIRKEIQLLRQPIRESRNALNVEILADKPDTKKINSLIDSISKNMAAIQKKEVFFMLWMREQLTPEQKQQLLALIKTRQRNMTGSPEAGSPEAQDF